MRVFNAILLGLLLAPWTFAQNTVLVNGSVADGTGKPRVLAGVRIRDGKIADIGPVKPTAGETVIDVKGMIVAPGFVDLQSLSPSAFQKDPEAASLIMQGVTTAVLGSEGSGPYAVEEFMLPFDEKPPALNIAMLVGHATVRRQIMGDDYKRSATADELKRMGELVADGMKEGAFGLGSDLKSEPASYSSPQELSTLARIVAQFGGTWVMSLRDEKEKVSDSVKQVIAIARDSKIPVQVLTTNKVAIAEIDKARAQRVDIGSDSYSFSQFGREKGVSAERAIQRLSAAPASRMSLRERGVLKKGAAADIVVFNPQSPSSGVKHVFVNGILVLKDGQPTGERPGHALR